jgi:Mg2+-importing ATPase
MNMGAIAAAIALPFLPWGVGAWFGFAAPPPLFFLFLAVATIAYLALVEIAKAIFYRALSRRQSQAAR